MLITQSKTNWKFLGVVIILAVVAGGGILWLGKIWQPPQPSELKIPEKSASETANWQTYRNEEQGFEIKYPENYEIDGTQITPIFEVYDNPSLLSLSEWVKSNALINDLSIKWEEILINGQKSLKSSVGIGGGGVRYYIIVLVPRNSKIYLILFATRASIFEAELKIFNQMLSTFRFVE